MSHLPHTSTLKRRQNRERKSQRIKNNQHLREHDPQEKDKTGIHPLKSNDNKPNDTKYHYPNSSDHTHTQLSHSALNSREAHIKTTLPSTSNPTPGLPNPQRSTQQSHSHVTNERTLTMRKQPHPPHSTCKYSSVLRRQQSLGTIDQTNKGNLEYKN